MRRLLARELPCGSLELIDGHLRKETTPDQNVPVLILDVTEAEADKILLTLDPLAAMAEAGTEQLDALLRSVNTGNQALAGMLTELAKDNGIIPADKKPDCVGALNPEFSVLIRCGDESEQRQVIEELDRNGLDSRSPVRRLAIATSDPAVTNGCNAAQSRSSRRIVRENLKSKPRRAPSESGRHVRPAAGFRNPSRNRSSGLHARSPLERVGLIVGPSGCGKSTIARELFGDSLVSGWPWPEDAALLDGFPQAMTTGEIVGLLSSVGFSSPPHWLKPFAAKLSNLESSSMPPIWLARLAELPDLAAIDEFTSVVDRTVAQVGSAAVAKAVRQSNRRLVAVTCHYDVEEWLQPDWKYEQASGKFQWRLLRRRPDIQLHIRRDPRSGSSTLFRGHHYLSKANSTDRQPCFICHRQPATRGQFTAVLLQPGQKRERLVARKPHGLSTGLPRGRHRHGVVRLGGEPLRGDRQALSLNNQPPGHDRQPELRSKNCMA